MKKDKLKTSVEKTKNETRDSLQLLFDNINKGQRKQIVKRPEIIELFKRYGVKY